MKRTSITIFLFALCSSLSAFGQAQPGDLLITKKATSGNTVTVIPADASQLIAADASAVSMGSGLSIDAGVLNVSALANSQLANSSITIAGVNTALGSGVGLDQILANGGTPSGTGFVKRTGVNTISIDTASYQVANATLSAVADGTYLGASSITTLGNITTGTWSGTAVSVAKGGTGLTSVPLSSVVVGNNSTTLSYVNSGSTANRALITGTLGALSFGQIDLSTGLVTGALPLANIAQGAATSGQVLTWNGTAWAPATTSGATLGANTFTAAQTINAGTVTTSTPFFCPSQTWNASGVVFQGAKLVVTNTAAATGSQALVFESPSGTTQLAWQYNTTTGNDASNWRMVFGSSASIGYASAYGAVTIRNAANSADVNLRCSRLTDSYTDTAYDASVGTTLNFADSSYDVGGVHLKNTAIIVWHTGSAGSGSATNAASIRTGSGTPEGSVTANAGSIFLRTDGGAGTTFYVKESGTGNTGWIAK